MKLLSSPTSPFARKVLICAHELGLADKLKVQRADVGPGKPNDEFAAINPLRKIPALVMDDGSTLIDSTVICEYLNDLGQGSLIPAKGPERWHVLTGHSVAQGMMDALILVRYENAVRPEAFRWDVWQKDQFDRAVKSLAWFETRAQQFSPTLNIEQIALGCALSYLDFRYADYDWRSAFPRVKAFFDTLSARPSFQATAPT